MRSTARPLLRRAWFQLAILAGLIGLWLLYAFTGIGLVQQRQVPSGGTAPGPVQRSGEDGLDGSK